VVLAVSLLLGSITREAAARGSGTVQVDLTTNVVVLLGSGKVTFGESGVVRDLQGKVVGTLKAQEVDGLSVTAHVTSRSAKHFSRGFRVEFGEEAKVARKSEAKGPGIERIAGEKKAKKAIGPAVASSPTPPPAPPCEVHTQEGDRLYALAQAEAGKKEEKNLEVIRSLLVDAVKEEKAAFIGGCGRQMDFGILNKELGDLGLKSGPPYADSTCAFYREAVDSFEKWAPTKPDGLGAYSSAQSSLAWCLQNKAEPALADAARWYERAIESESKARAAGKPGLTDAGVLQYALGVLLCTKLEVPVLADVHLYEAIEKLVAAKRAGESSLQLDQTLGRALLVRYGSFVSALGRSEEASALLRLASDLVPEEKEVKPRIESFGAAKLRGIAARNPPPSKLDRTLAIVVDDASPATTVEGGSAAAPPTSADTPPSRPAGDQAIDWDRH
jgi:tetratricopeptide (TPR) repeat protein